MTRPYAISLLVQSFKLDQKLASQILDFIEWEIGMHPPTFKSRSWVTHFIEEWEVDAGPES